MAFIHPEPFGTVCLPTGKADGINEGNVEYSIITAAATSSDTNYNGVNSNDVTVTNVNMSRFTYNSLVATDFLWGYFRMWERLDDDNVYQWSAANTRCAALGKDGYFDW